MNISKLAANMSLSADQIRNSLRMDETALSVLENDGLIEYSQGDIRVTDEGTFFIRNIAASIDKAYTEKVQTYSKPV
jgi:oxygen-independent coproporphyrinogen-3 oxidase